MKFFSIELYDPKAGLLQFYFNEKHFLNYSQYDICVVDTQKTTHHFTMQQRNREWKIVHPPKLPKWILSFERTLSNAIFEHLARAHDAKQKG